MKIVTILLALVATGHATTFTYDDAGQLIAESYPNGAHAFYEYDNIGNPVRRTTVPPDANPQSNLSINSSVSPDPATAGAPVTVTFTVSNNGPAPATAVTLTDTFPAEFVPVSAKASQGNCELDGQDLSCLLGTLADAQVVTVTVEGTAVAGGTLATTATVTAPEESDASDNSTTTNTPIGGGIDLAISLFQRGPSPATNTGTTLIFVARALNKGPSEATNVVHTFNLPPELSFIFAVPGTGTFTHNAGVVTCELGTVASGDEVETIVFAAPTGATGSFNTTSTLAANEGEIEPADNTASLDTEVIGATITVTNTNDSGAGSLRQAILDANANPNADVIGFNLPQNVVQTITPLGDLPAITEPVMIDGISAAAGLVEVNGTNLLNGITINADNTRLRGLVINRCTRTAIRARGTAGDRLTGLTIQGCILGLNANGNAALGNGDHGIDFADVDDSSIGGSEFWMANTISGNENNGIVIDDTCNNLTIAGNRIGIDLTAEIAIGNGNDGIQFQGTNSLIGGTGPTDGNLISGNGDYGIDLSGEGNRVFQNLIGTDFGGLDAVPNGHANTSRAGLIAGSFSEDNPNVIGGTTEEERNLISGNHQRNVHLLPGAKCIGNFIGPDITGNAVLGGRPTGVGVELNNGATLGGILPGEGNVISGNDGHGVLIEDFIGGDTFVFGNKIGVGFDGVTDRGNNDAGVAITNPQGRKFIGFDVEGAGNILSGNSDQGVFLDRASFGAPAPENVVIQGNKIGTDESGTRRVGNSDQGITVNRGINVTIGSVIAAGRNIISGNSDQGIEANSGAIDLEIIGNFIGTDVTGTDSIGNTDEGIDCDADSTLIQGNLVSGNGNSTLGFRAGMTLSGDNIRVLGNQVGTDITGTLNIGNGSDGISVTGDNSLIGGPDLDQGNIISGNRSSGIRITGGDTTVQNNRIGTSADGLAPLANGDGITTFFADNLVIENNLISANDADGIVISGADGVIRRNSIGVDISGAPLGNGANGIRNDTSNPAAINTLGGTAPGDGNVIAHNTLDGVRVNGAFGDPPTFGSLAILGNSIYSNGGLGIDLSDPDGTNDGVTPNDPLDADNGNNSFQNFPLITTAGSSISSTINSEASKTYRIEFFVNSMADPSGHGEGETFLGTIDVTTDASGNAAFTFDPPSALANGQFVTATATNPNNQTSEFGPALIVNGGGGFVDSDGDGMSDAYELEHFGSETGGDASIDSDSDGQSNLAEFLALTDPNDGGSVFEATGRFEGDSFIIVIQSESGRLYQLSESDDLGEFTPLGDPIVGNGGLIEFEHESPGNRRFYKVTISLP